MSSLRRDTVELHLIEYFKEITGRPGQSCCLKQVLCVSFRGRITNEADIERLEVFMNRLSSRISVVRLFNTRVLVIRRHSLPARQVLKFLFGNLSGFLAVYRS
jgi:hypothetical protein